MKVVKPTDLPSGDPGLQVTATALDHVRKKLTLSKQQQAVGVRVDVKKAGCSGYEYVLSYAYQDSAKSLDFAFEFDGIMILIDKAVYGKFFQGGTVMDFKQEGVNEGLDFKNPNVGHQCGCGESFTLVSEKSQ